MSGFEFDSVAYYDDRMFVLSICMGTVIVREDVVETTIHHDNPPADCVWCLVTYRNAARYPATRVDHFESRAAAVEYLELVEPTVPRVSLQGRSPATTQPYGEWAAWKARNSLKEYDFRTLHGRGAMHRHEVIIMRKQTGG